MEKKSKKHGGGGGAARLIFPPSAGTVSGVNAASLSTYGPDPASCVRELIQNALDSALVDAKRDVCRVRFVIKRHNTADIPGIEEYRRALAGVQREETNAQSRDIIDNLAKRAKEEKTSTLLVMDNGVGFDKTRLGAMLADGISAQAGEESRGAFGNGHLTAFALSGLRYIFYGGVRGDARVFSGHAVLMSHVGGDDNGEQKALSNHGYFIRGINDKTIGAERFSYADDIPPPLREEADKMAAADWGGSGAIIAITGFNDFGGEDAGIEDIILRETALNFYVAVHQKILSVEIARGGDALLLTPDNLRETLEKYKDKKKGKGGFPSGHRVWNSYETLTKGARHDIDTSRGKVRLFIRQDGDGKRVALCRNGMWIDGKPLFMWPADFTDRKPFDALLLVDAESAGKAHSLIKLAETPMHNEIEIKRVQDGAKRKALTALLKEIRDNVKARAARQNDDVFSPDDIMPIQSVDPAFLRGEEEARKRRGAVKFKMSSRPIARGALEAAHYAKGLSRSP